MAHPSTTMRAPYAVRQEDDFEPQLGLPERLPAGEQVLWQGGPAWGAVWRHVFHGGVLSAYFAALLAWQVWAALDAGVPLAEAARPALRAGSLYALALGLLALLAWLTARTTLYTLTHQRIVMRIGIVLTVSYNLPLRCIDAAHLRPLTQRRGDIALELAAHTRIAWLHLWPHARPWRVKRPQPMLRCLDSADAVARQIVDAWAVANSRPSAALAGPALPLERAPA
jgi:hypothetical protein